MGLILLLMTRYMFGILLILLTTLVCQRQGSLPSRSNDSDDLSLYKVKQNGKWGYINKISKFVIYPQFDSADDFKDGLARVAVGREPDGIFSKVLVLEEVLTNAKWGFIDKTGKFIIPPIYEYLAPFFSEGLAYVQINGKSGFIDQTGKMVIQPQFDNASFFREGLACVQIGEKYGFIDKTGKVVIRPQFDENIV